ncbi:hypothetical protein [Rhizobium sp. 12,4]
MSCITVSPGVVISALLVGEIVGVLLILWGFSILPSPLPLPRRWRRRP